MSNDLRRGKSVGNSSANMLDGKMRFSERITDQPHKERFPYAVPNNLSFVRRAPPSLNDV